jgi:nucleoside diphosphate kinase
VTAPGPAPGAGRSVLAAVLGMALDAELSGRTAALPYLRHPWDAWWVAIRSGSRVRPEAGTYGACPACASVAADAYAKMLAVPARPGKGDCACGCHQRWAQAMRSPLSHGCLPLPPQRLTVALLKPGAPRLAIRGRLRRELREVHLAERHLTPGDCRRLYPDAYGADFVTQRTEYMTSSSIQVLVLAGGADAVTRGAALKHAIRADLGAGALRNHLHMPDNPAEALADIALLAGWDLLQRHYRRWEGSDAQFLADRLAGYRAYLDRWASSAGMGRPQPPHTAAEPATAWV